MVDNTMEMAELLTFGVKQKASDLHLSPDQPPILRINGDLFPATIFQHTDRQRHGYVYIRTISAIFNG